MDWRTVVVLRLGVLVASVLLGWMLPFSAGSAVASVHSYFTESYGVVHRSLNPLRDRNDLAWQVILFQQQRLGEPTTIHLRLVGFPGRAHVQPAQPLRVTSATETWFAADVLAPTSPLPDNVGEYDFQPVITQLASNAPLYLSLPTQPQPTELVVPPFVVKEWREVHSMTPPSHHP